MSEETQRCSIIVFSGDMDKVMAAFIIATTAAAMGMETTMFFTFWGLKAIQKGTPTGEGLFGKMLSMMNRGGIVTSLPELRQMAIDLDVKFLACLMSMDVMEISQADLIDEVHDVVGAATYIADAQDAQINLFI
jgi:peroxiredoxin family protein